MSHFQDMLTQQNPEKCAIIDQTYFHDLLRESWGWARDYTLPPYSTLTHKEWHLVHSERQALLLYRNLQLEKKNERGESLLQVAVINGDLGKAKTLISKV